MSTVQMLACVLRYYGTGLCYGMMLALLFRATPGGS